MRKIFVTSLATFLCILPGANIAKSQEQGNKKPDLIPKNSDELDLSGCNANYKICSDISEAANTINYVYKNGRSDKETEAEAIKNLTSRDHCNSLSDRCGSDSRWDAGYLEKNIKFIDKKAYLFGIPDVDVQAIVAQKTVYEGGKQKKIFLITIKGTELDINAPNPLDKATDIINNLRATSRSIPVHPNSEAEVPMGFYDSAQTLMSTQEFIDLLKNIKDASKNGDNFEVLVTGHSLGGATATAIKAYIEDSLPETDKTKIKAITFGSPPAGNQKFQEKYGERVTAINIDGDPISSAGNPAFSTRIGQQYIFQIPEAQANAQKKYDSIYWFGTGSVG